MKRVTGIIAVLCLLGAVPMSLAYAAGDEAPQGTQVAPGSATAATLDAAVQAQTGNPAEGAAPAATPEAAQPSVEPSNAADNAPNQSADSAAAAPAAEEPELPNIAWSFDGPSGHYDRAQLQRGFQIYSQVCSACHSMNLLSYRNLTALGYSADEVKAIAASHQVTDGPNDEGEMFQRAGLPSDRFVSPFPNVKAAAAANNGAVPPDMSLLAKAREGGPRYIYGILTGFENPPANASIPAGRYWNKYMPGHVIAMPPPIQPGQVSYEDGTPETLDQYARDVAAFLAWASEPHMEDRKRTGIKVLLFLLVFTGVMYAAKKKIWTDAH